MNEPNQIAAGFSARWTEAPSAYPAPTWTLEYRLVGRADAYVVTATQQADGTHAVSIDPATSATFAPGRYRLIGYVDDGTERHRYYEGDLVVTPNVTAGDPVDLRSHAERMVEALEAALEGRATADQMAVAIGGRSLQRHTLAELQKLHQVYAYQVEVERGRMAPTQSIGIRFGGRR